MYSAGCISLEFSCCSRWLLIARGDSLIDTLFIGCLTANGSKEADLYACLLEGSTRFNDNSIYDSRSQLVKLNCKNYECFFLILQNGLVIPISLACKAPENLISSQEYTLLVSVSDSRIASLPLPHQKVTTVQNKIGTAATLSVAPSPAPIEEKQLIAGTVIMQSRTYIAPNLRPPMSDA